MLQSVAPKLAKDDDSFGSFNLSPRKRGPTLREVPAPSARQASPPPTRPGLLKGDRDWLTQAASLAHLDVSYDPQDRILWQYMNPRQRPSFTTDLLNDIGTVMDLLEAAAAAQGEAPIRYLVFASHLPGIFNLGGDLPLFLRAIRAGDRAVLDRYAQACVDALYRRAVHPDLPFHTICLVQGDALGGGFEAALAHDVIIAERRSQFGLPEILFNLFPGMGAYSFLSRRLDAARAERMILSGRLYSADELHAMGLVDTVAEDGCGREAVAEYIARDSRAHRARQAVRSLSQLVNPVTREELMRIADLWVETALALEPRDLRRMEHLALAQDRRWAKLRGPVAAAAE